MSQDKSKEFTLRVKIDALTHPLLYDALKDLTGHGRCDRVRLLAQQGLLMEQLGALRESEPSPPPKGRRGRKSKGATTEAEARISPEKDDARSDLAERQTAQSGSVHSRHRADHAQGASGQDGSESIPPAPANQAPRESGNGGQEQSRPAQPPEAQELSMRLMQKAGALSFQSPPGESES